MRSELALPVALSRKRSAQADFWTLAACCLFGLSAWICFAVMCPAFNQIPVLMLQYNLFG
jgi:hypothetical protein